MTDVVPWLGLISALMAGNTVLLVGMWRLLGALCERSKNQNRRLEILEGKIYGNTASYGAAGGRGAPGNRGGRGGAETENETETKGEGGA